MTESQQSTSSYRVKLYELVDGNWTDRGTGKCYYKMVKFTHIKKKERRACLIGLKNFLS